MPCIAGCEGPRFTTRFSVPPSGTPSPRKNSWVRRAAGADGVALAGMGVGVIRAVSVPGPDEGLPLAHGVVLEQGMPLELLVQEEPPEIGVPGEPEPEHVPHLTLEPVG